MTLQEAYQFGLITFDEYLELETYRICVKGDLNPDEENFVELLKEPMPEMEETRLI